MPSPEPRRILELEAGALAICAGGRHAGGGHPGGIRGVGAVIDQDLAAAPLAITLKFAAGSMGPKDVFNNYSPFPAACPPALALITIFDNSPTVFTGLRSAASF